VAEAPSPYAPGIVADERAPARAAGRPVVFLGVAVVGVSLVSLLPREVT
jgi:hypothetical protein